MISWSGNFALGLLSKKHITGKFVFKIKNKEVLNSTYNGREDPGLSSLDWLLITLMSALVTGEGRCLRGEYTACWHGRRRLKDVLLIILEPYLAFIMTHQQRLEGWQLHLVWIFPDVDIFSLPLWWHFHVVQYLPQNCNNMLPKIGTVRHIAIFFLRVPFIHLLFGKDLIALWGLFIKFTVVQRDSELLLRQKESGESMSEQAYISSSPGEKSPHLKRWSSFGICLSGNIKRTIFH